MVKKVIHTNGFIQYATVTAPKLYWDLHNDMLPSGTDCGMQKVSAHGVFDMSIALHSVVMYEKERPKGISEISHWEYT